MSVDLSLYQKDLEIHKVQHIVIDQQFKVLESCNSIVTFNKLDIIHEQFPFFLSFEELLQEKKDASYTFSCIHFLIEENEVICDVIIKTFKDKDALIIIQDFTSHYNDYQSTSQERNVSIISKEKLALQHLLLKNQEAFKNKFIANFSHELREPLSSIISFNEFLSATDLDYQQKNYLDLTQSSSLYLKRIIDDILLLSTLQTKQSKLTDAIFNLKGLLKEIAQIYKYKAEKKGLTFTYIDDSKTDILVVSDSIKLRQLLTNLLSNAIKFTTKGHVEFKVICNQVRARKQNITFEISDTGCGIEKKSIKTIFHSFTKEENKEYKTPGFGLGLSIASEIANLFKGKIEVDSVLGKGSTFEVNLNLKVENKQKEEKTEKDLLEVLENREPIKVLLVEDSEMIQMTLLKICSKINNVNLDILSKPSDLLETIEITDYAIILMNINLKEHNGISLTKKIRGHRHKTLKKTPVIAITGDVFAKDLKTYTKAGINYTLKKPFTKQEFYEALLSQL